jgi:hypothetical protein
MLEPRHATPRVSTQATGSRRGERRAVVDAEIPPDDSGSATARKSLRDAWIVAAVGLVRAVPWSTDMDLLEGMKP